MDTAPWCSYHVGVRRIAASAALVSACVLAPPAHASELIDRDAAGVRLAVNAKGQALLTYRTRGRLRRVLAWGAVDARPLTAGRPQVSFRLDYSGGWRTARRRTWIGFRNACGRYDGPPLPWLVTACKAPDGSYWAVQSWQRMLPNYGLAGTRAQRAWELRLAHWTGELPRLEINLNWAYRRYDHLYGRFSYRGRPVFGFRVTPQGSPLDRYGRNVYVDTLDSVYGRGWRRENSFLTHTGSGAFCYGFFPHGPRPSGMGRRYRATVIGPGVTPDVTWEADAPGPYNRDADAQANAQIRTLGSARCRPN